MEKEFFKPGNMLYPIPAVMISCADKDNKPNIITVAWAGTVCSSPAMVSVSVRKERHSYEIMKESGEFVINLVTENLTKAADFCGVRSGRDIDKFKEMKLTPVKGKLKFAPMIEESPVNIECKIKTIIPLGSHDMFLAEVISVAVDKKYIDDKGKFHLNQTKLIVYSHGEYYGMGDLIGKFGYSVQKNKSEKNKTEKNKAEKYKVEKYKVEKNKVVKNSVNGKGKYINNDMKNAYKKK